MATIKFNAPNKTTAKTNNQAWFCGQNSNPKTENWGKKYIQQPKKKA
jgi:hypothetical protein